MRSEHEMRTEQANVSNGAVHAAARRHTSKVTACIAYVSGLFSGLFCPADSAAAVAEHERLIAQARKQQGPDQAWHEEDFSSLRKPAR